ncbi:MAG TPA: hypothetical protein VJ001_15845 [Rhodocyclaceae bacterium]|nr:hypothetical protein [Rhodocyclaceae bacterium]
MNATPATETSATAEELAAKPTSKRSRKAAHKIADPIADAVATPEIASTEAAAPVSVSVATTDDDKIAKAVKPKKIKQIRDSFTMPEAEYDLIGALKKRCIAKGLAVKKSEVLRAAIIAFAAQSDDDVKAALQSLAVIKTGRPPKQK